MINTVSQRYSANTNMSFKSNRMSAVHQAGKFFERQVKAGSVKLVKSDYIDTLGARIAHADRRPYVMGVTAYSGAGKSFFNSKMKEAAPSQITIITGDSLYRDLAPEFAKERKAPDGRIVSGFEGMVYGGWCFEGPHNFDTVRGAQKIDVLKNGLPVKFDKYLMDNTGRVAKDAIDLVPAPLVLVDGVCNVFKPLSDSFDARTFYDTPYQTIEQRYFIRGRSPFDEKLLANSQEGGHKYIDPEIPNMDIIFNGEMAVENMKKFARGFVDLLTK